MDKKIKYYTQEELKQLIIKKLMLAKVNEKQAQEVANHLVYADARGIHSHGSNRVKSYILRIKRGFCNLNPNIKYVSTATSTGYVDGDNSLGVPVAKLAMEKAIEIAKNHGVAIIGAKDLNHSGTMAYYLEMAAKENLVALAVATAPPQVAPYGGSQAYFGTNPLGFVAPVKDSRPIIVDMATSVKAFGYVMEARNKGEEIPLGWAIDDQGNPTTDPNKAALMLPFAEAKGYSIMLMINILAGIMLNIPAGDNIPSTFNNPDSKLTIGQLFIVINPANFMPIDKFLDDMKQMSEEIKSNKPANGFEKVMLPGEIADNTYQEYLKTGIPISKVVADYLEDETKL
ncbi:ureidoglycolate dehydrogenase [Mycoplasma sp. P36-A1]|uniref:ureidoglycolate dehydrogenase n=1 Tax=Mycoplasma sp. P36-A1 TaxID=3252900 RepID=UPI003C2AC089